MDPEWGIHNKWAYLLKEISPFIVKELILTSWRRGDQFFR
ncbi:Hypothetical protein Cp267_1220 [Corynebacterium pseudotuberculosis 267]|nr:Hypothetical protein Cp267_1220 [Corynebacterium pseudotuberculosis 267]